MKKQKKEYIPKGLRALIYSYLPFDHLIKSISKLSKTDRDMLVKSDILDQPRSLKITFRDEYIMYISSLKYMMKLLISKKRSMNPCSQYEQRPSNKDLIKSSDSRSVNSSSPVLNNNNRIRQSNFDTNSD